MSPDIEKGSGTESGTSEKEDGSPFSDASPHMPTLPSSMPPAAAPGTESTPQPDSETLGEFNAKRNSAGLGADLSDKPRPELNYRIELDADVSSGSRGSGEWFDVLRYFPPPPAAVSSPEMTKDNCKTDVKLAMICEEQDAESKKLTQAAQPIDPAIGCSEQSSASVRESESTPANVEAPNPAAAIVEVESDEIEQNPLAPLERRKPDWMDASFTGHVFYLC